MGIVNGGAQPHPAEHGRHRRAVVPIAGPALSSRSGAHRRPARFEHHFGEDLLVTRKGAIRAGAGELGIIPGSMGAKSFIVRGKGNAQSFCSASHGAGRRMSRTQTRRAFTNKDLARQTEGVECRKDSGVVDEAPKGVATVVWRA